MAEKLTTSLAFQSATSLLEKIRTRQISSVELLDIYIGRIERYDPLVNSVVVRDFERARERAREADRALARGQTWGALHGLPMTVKESFSVAGLATTRGVPALSNNIAQSNMLAVDRLLAAGAVIFGKTNVPKMLADWQSFNELFGTTNNPYDLKRTPGGSSGGSAAALAAGLTAMEAGSDIAASIRQPAHACGVYGHKPTHGICPTRGHELGGKIAPRDISVIGPMGRSPDDLELGLGVMAGPDEFDAVGTRLVLPRPVNKKLEHYRVSVMLDHELCEVDRTVQDAIQRLADYLASRGVKVSTSARPNIDIYQSNQVFLRLLRAASAGRLTDSAFLEELERVRALSPDDESAEAIESRANVMYHRDWHFVNETRYKLRVAWAEFFKEWDLLLCPVASTPAIPHDQPDSRVGQTVMVNGKPRLTSDEMFWAGFASVVFLPITVAPIAQTSEGLPIGVQIVGPQYHDLVCIEFARLLQREYRGFVPPKGFE